MNTLSGAVAAKLAETVHMLFSLLITLIETRNIHFTRPLYEFDRLKETFQNFRNSKAKISQSDACPPRSWNCGNRTYNVNHRRRRCTN